MEQAFKLNDMQIERVIDELGYPQQGDGREYHGNV